MRERASHHWKLDAQREMVVFSDVPRQRFEPLPSIAIASES
jgi:hypothetical protein